MTDTALAGDTREGRLGHLSGLLREARSTGRVMFGTGWRAAPGLTVACVLVSLIGGLAAVSYPVGFRILIDHAISRDARGVAVGVVIISVTFALSWVLTSLSGVVTSLLTDRCNLYLAAETGRLTSTAATLDLLERPDYATEIEALTRDRRMLARAIGQVLSLIQVGIQVVAILVLVALIYPLVLLVPLLAIAPAVADRRAARMQKSSDDALAEKRRLQTQLFGLTTGSGPARELRSFDATGAVLDRHARLHAEINAETMRTARSAALWASLGWLVYAAGFVVGIALLVLRAVHGLASPGEVVEVIGLVRRAQRQVSTASDGSTSFATAVRTAGRMRWLARYVQGGPRPQVSAPVPGRLAQGIRLEGIGFTYPLGGKQALRDVTVTLPAGATVALVGDNGAGKTTLVKLLTGLYRPTEGRITVDGADLAHLEAAEWRSRAAGTFQDFLNLQMLVREGVGVGDLPRIEDRAAVGAALGRADATTVAEALPDGIETLVGRFVGGRELSGGQWQRLALARGLMREDPLVVVLDEPTSSLDAHAEAALFRRYAEAAHRLGQANGTVTVLVTHRFSTVRMADLIIVLAEGQVAEVGSHQELMAAGGQYAELVKLQAKSYLS